MHRRVHGLQGLSAKKLCPPTLVTRKGEHFFSLSCSPHHLNTQTRCFFDARGEHDKLIPTMNKTGWATTRLDPISLKAVDFASTLAHAGRPFLDIGAAYGLASLRVCRNSNQDLHQYTPVIALDCESQHLDAIRLKAAAEGFSLGPGKQLETMCETFPFQSDSPRRTKLPFPLGSVLISRVLHFFDGETLRLALEQIYDALEPRGKLFVVSETPYLKRFAYTFVPLYEMRRKIGEEWPGTVENMTFNEGDTVNAKVSMKDLPEFMHLLDVEVLTRELKRARFEVEECRFMDRKKDFPETWLLDGRESVGAVAVKPLVK